jgi:hypothetical protein
LGEGVTHVGGAPEVGDRQSLDREAAAEFGATDQDAPGAVTIEVQCLLLLLDLGVAVHDDHGVEAVLGDACGRFGDEA